MACATCGRPADVLGRVLQGVAWRRIVAVGYRSGVAGPLECVIKQSGARGPYLLPRGPRPALPIRGGARRARVRWRSCRAIPVHFSRKSPRAPRQADTTHRRRSMWGGRRGGRAALDPPRTVSSSPPWSSRLPSGVQLGRGAARSGRHIRRVPFRTHSRRARDVDTGSTPAERKSLFAFSVFLAPPAARAAGRVGRAGRDDCTRVMMDPSAPPSRAARLAARLAEYERGWLAKRTAGTPRMHAEGGGTRRARFDVRSPSEAQPLGFCLFHHPDDLRTDHSVTTLRSP